VKAFVFTLMLVVYAIAAGGAVWFVFGMVLGQPALAWRLAWVQALVILGHGALLNPKFLRAVTPGRFLVRLVPLQAAALAAYLACCRGSGWEMLVGAHSIGTGVSIFLYAQLELFPDKPAAEKKTNRPDSRAGLRTLKEARALARAALPAGDSGLYWGGALIRSTLARLGPLLVRPVGSGQTTLLRHLLHSRSALPAIRPGNDCRAWILDPKLEMVPIVRGIVGDQCPVIVMLPTDLRSRKWRVSADIKDEASCRQFAALLAQGWAGETPFWTVIVEALITTALIYLVRTKGLWDLRDLVLILDDEELIRQVLERIAGEHYVRQVFTSAMMSRSIEVLLAFTTAELRLIAAMWDDASEEVSLDWWSKNPAILVVGTDLAFAKTLNALIRMMFKRTSELLLAQGPDPTGQRSTWLVLDDLPALGRLDGLEALCLRARACGCTLLLSFGVFPGVSTFHELKPHADTAGFLPRPPEHRRLRPFGEADYNRLQLEPPDHEAE